MSVLQLSADELAEWLRERRRYSMVTELGTIECSGPVGRYVARRLDGTGLCGPRGRLRRFASEDAAVVALEVDHYTSS